MLLTSKFNPKELWMEFLLFLLVALSLMHGAFRLSFTAVFVVLCSTFAIVLMFWAFRLKVITVTEKDMEVKRVCFPFLKRFYRLVEFDSYVVEQKGNTEYLHLLCQGRRAVTLSSRIYRNYAELKESLSVVGLKKWGTDASRAVDSVFSKSYLAAVFFLLLFVLFGIAIPVCEYLEQGEITKTSYFLTLVYEIVFLPIFLCALYGCKRLTIWREHLQARSMLCPWKEDYYSLDEFDSAIEVITPNGHGSEDISFWLIRDGKMAVSISQSLYANYDTLEHAIGVKPSQTIQMSVFKSLRYHLGKSVSSIL